MRFRRNIPPPSATVGFVRVLGGVVPLGILLTALLFWHVLQREELWARSAAAKLHGEAWTLRVTPHEATLVNFRSPLPIFVLIAGALMAALVWGLFYYVERAHVTHRELRESEARFRSAIQTMHEGVVLQHREDGIVLCNRRAWEILGLTEDQLRGRTSHDPRWQAVHEDETPWPGDTHPAMVTLREGVEQIGVVMGIHTPEGKRVWVSIHAIPMFHEGETLPYAAVVTFTDISERRWLEGQISEQISWVQESNVELKQQQQALAHANFRLETLATTDGLTGLKNHRAFQSQLIEEFTRARRYGVTFSLLLLDVDAFKEFNDRFGHPAGDQVLRQLATILQSTGRATDYVARYGGEEFVILLPEIGAEDSLRIAERFRAAIEAQEWPLRAITASFGAATLSSRMQTGQELVELADRALYASKAAGRNRVTHAESLSAVAPVC